MGWRMRVQEVRRTGLEPGSTQVAACTGLLRSSTGGLRRGAPSARGAGGTRQDRAHSPLPSQLPAQAWARGMFIWRDVIDGGNNPHRLRVPL